MHAMFTLQFVWDLARTRWLAILLIVTFVAILVQYTLKLQNSEHGNRSAFLRWRTQLADLDDSVNFWEKYAYPNPPIMAILLKPFMALPPLLGATLWFTCKALFALASILCVLPVLDAPDRPFPMWGKLLAIALSLRPIAGDLTHGNVNLLILFLVVMSLVATAYRYHVLTGLLLGLAIACKITPALFVFYFLWKRSWTTLTSIVLSLVVFVLLIPACVYGWDNNLEYLQSWHQQMVAPYAAGVVSSEHKNQSLPGLLHRMLSEEPSFSDYDGDRKIVLDMHNFVDWDRSVVQSIVVVGMALFAGLAMLSWRGTLDKSSRLRLTAEYSVVILGMLLFCERTWKHHCVTLLLPFAVLAYGVSTTTFTRGMRWFLGGTLVVASLLMLSTSTGVFDKDSNVRDQFGKLAQVYGAYTWAFFVLLAGVLATLFRLAEYDAEKRKEPTCPAKP
jgi:alpha-1,2-mannosyltransferase